MSSLRLKSGRVCTSIDKTEAAIHLAVIESIDHLREIMQSDTSKPEEKLVAATVILKAWVGMLVERQKSGTIGRGGRYDS